MSRMTRPRPLPPTLTGSVFTTRDATALGVSPNRLRSSDLHSRVWGVRAETAPTTLRDRVQLVLTRMPPLAFVSHTTAARLHGIPLPPWLEQDYVDVSVPAPDRAPHAQGLRGHRLTLGDGDLVTADGMRITSPARTWFDLGTILRVEDLVAAGDRLLDQRAPLATVEELGTKVAEHRGERGTRRLTTALPLLSAGAESPQESRLRALLVLGGLPEPAVNPVLRDAKGAFLARADLVFREYGLVIEYQGDYHRDQHQWRADITRRSKLEAAGWTVLEVASDDLRNSAELIARIRATARRRELPSSAVFLG